MTSLPSALLEQLLTELSTLASVYHKPPESFVGKGRFGADAIQRAAIQEQRQNAADNPIAASVAAAAAAANGTSGSGQSGNNIENLLDIDFDGAAPASAEQNPSGNGTPVRMSSPTAVGGLPGAPASGGMADMMGLFDAPASGAASGAASSSSPAPGSSSAGANDIMNGFAGMDLSGSSAPPPPGQQLGYSAPQKNSSGGEDLLGLF